MTAVVSQAGSSPQASLSRLQEAASLKNHPQPWASATLRAPEPAHIDTVPTHPGSRMEAGTGSLLSTLLGLLLLSTPGTRGANPALVARITDKGLEYGKKPHCRLA